MDEPVFDLEKMMKLTNKDRLLSLVFNDLMSRKDFKDEREVYHIIFNGYVLNDSIMEDEYMNC
ncbi:hypothetical protein [Cytobacillus oceanisediminis]|uniref:Fur-regulated basic protein A n=2 Tax=Cytobacillus TaxID=2675230 RepID=A0ABX3CLV7_9BACI|nr:hypothetical protein [Cytobacillus oceanisediminis]OHX42895.1 hypothetical protein BBV17_26620 [Cytobacillus oceanisediminis]